MYICTYVNTYLRRQAARLESNSHRYICNSPDQLPIHSKFFFPQFGLALGLLLSRCIVAWLPKLSLGLNPSCARKTQIASHISDLIDWAHGPRQKKPTWHPARMCRSVDVPLLHSNHAGNVLMWPFSSAANVAGGHGVRLALGRHSKCRGSETIFLPPSLTLFGIEP